MKSRITKALSWAIFPALLVGGFAIAAPDNGGSDSSGTSADDQTFQVAVPAPGAGTATERGVVVAGTEGPGVPPGRPPKAGIAFFGDDGGDVTYSEIHVMRDGAPVVLRDDRGEIASVSSDSITVTENDGNDVTIPVDSDTKVLIPPDKPGEMPADSTVDDLETGQQVMVHREEGQAADFIGVIPDNAERHFLPLPPPPGVAPDAPSGDDNSGD
jgi:hypothetical protein